MPKEKKIITDIEIIVNSEFSSKMFSEGQKRMILLYWIFELATKENSLILLDEPDSHIHDGKKISLLDILIKYSSEHKRQILMTTHSPTLIEKVPEKSLISLKSENNQVEILDFDKIKLLQQLTDNQISIVDSLSFISSSNPLIVLEGKTDVNYVKEAKARLGITTNFELIEANGTGNINHFLESLKTLVPNREIHVFVDRDEAGANAIQSVSGEYPEIESNNIFKIDNTTTTIQFLPYKENVTEGKFLIEGYFSSETILNAIDTICGNHDNIENKMLNYPNLSNKIKEKIGKTYKNLPDESYVGFSVFLESLSSFY